MSDANSTQRCTHCGAEFTASSSPLGLCPSCLLRLGMSDPAMTPPAQEPEPGVVATVTPPTTAPPVRRLRFPTRRVAIAIAALLAIGVAALNVFLHLQPVGESTATHANAVRFSLNLPDGTRMPDEAQFAVSEDGTQVVVAAQRHDGVQRLWLRRLQSLEWRELPRTDRAMFPFWSPDARHIGFFDGRSVKRIDIGNDLTETICDVNNGRGGTWSSQGVIVFAGSGGLFQVAASGGSPSQVTKLAPEGGETAHLRPQFLPDGRRFIFLARHVKDRSSTTYIRDLDTGETAAIVDGRGPAAFAGGRLLVSRGSALTAQQLDHRRGRLLGEARTIGGVEEITSDVTKGSAFAAASTVLVYQPREPRQRRLLWFNREGVATGPESDITDAAGFALSPDGRRVAVTHRDADADTSSIWLMDVDSPRRLTRVTWGQVRDESPVWSPDGSRVAYSSHRGENQGGVHIVARDLNGMEESLFQAPDAQLTDWSRDGRFLIYSALNPTTHSSDLWILPLSGDRKPQVLEQTPANESQGILSPDGRLMAYVSDQSGSDEVFVRMFPPSEGRWQISTGGGARPRWRDDGRELFFLSPDGQVMALDVASSSPPQYGVPRPLLVVTGAVDFAVRGRQQFLVQMPVDQTGERQLEVILNWAAELRR